MSQSNRRTFLLQVAACGTALSAVQAQAQGAKVDEKDPRTIHACSKAKIKGGRCLATAALEHLNGDTFLGVLIATLEQNGPDGLWRNISLPLEDAGFEAVLGDVFMKGLMRYFESGGKVQQQDALRELHISPMDNVVAISHYVHFMSTRLWVL